MTLDPTTWNLDVLNPNDVLEPVFQRLATQFNMSDYADSIYLSFKGLIAALRQQQAYFHLIRRSSISGFWQEIIQSTNIVKIEQKIHKKYQNIAKICQIYLRAKNDAIL